MDYADCIWSPHLKVDIAQLEKAQRRTTRLVPDLRDRCYEYRVVDDWNSLPSKVVEARDLEQFKAELDKAWKDIRFLHTALYIHEPHTYIYIGLHPLQILQ